MTSEQKKAIDACKDQAAQEFKYPFKDEFFEGYDMASLYAGHKQAENIVERAMQLYGEQCREESVKPFLCNKCGGFYDRYNGLCHSCSNENIAAKA